MNAGYAWMAAAFVAAILVLSGCKSADDEFAPATQPKTYTFEGKVEPKYVGEWKTPDGNSTIDIRKDGSLNVDTVSHSMKGRSEVKVSGQWLASDDNLLFEYTDKTQQSIVLKYATTLNGTTLILQQAGGGQKTTYHRK